MEIDFLCLEESPFFERVANLISIASSEPTVGINEWLQKVLIVVWDCNAIVVVQTQSVKTFERREINRNRLDSVAVHVNSRELLVVSEEISWNVLDGVVLDEELD